MNNIDSRQALLACFVQFIVAQSYSISTRISVLYNSDRKEDEEVTASSTRASLGTGY